MKHRHSILVFLSGIFVTLLLIGIVLPAVAANEMTITVNPGVKIYINDVKLDPRDVNGKPVEVFIYKGTTYLPVRAVSEALSQEVNWDGSTGTVYIGKHEESSSYLLNACPPYQTNGYKTPATVIMSGKKYANCMTLSNGYGYALFNLNGKYQQLDFDVGHIDEETMGEGTLNFYLDGNLAFSIDLLPEMLPKHYSIPLNGALQMKIEAAGNRYHAHIYSLANITVS